MAVWKLGPALAAGDGAVIKPASRTPRATLRLMALIAEAGAPAGLVNAVTGSTEIGEVLVRHAGVDMVTTAASTSTERQVMEGAVTGVNLGLASSVWTRDVARALRVSHTA